MVDGNIEYIVVCKIGDWKRAYYYESKEALIEDFASNPVMENETFEVFVGENKHDEFDKYDGSDPAIDKALRGP